MTLTDRERELEREGFFKVEDTPMGMNGYAEVPYIGYRCPACGGVHPESPHMRGTGHAPGCWFAVLAGYAVIPADIIDLVCGMVAMASAADGAMQREQVTDSNFTVEIDGEYGENDGVIRLMHHEQEIVMWDSAEWIEDPSLVFVIVNAIRIGFTEGPQAIADRIGVTLTGSD